MDVGPLADHGLSSYENPLMTSAAEDSSTASLLEGDDGIMGLLLGPAHRVKRVKNQRHAS